jgi:hypothetical protein
MHCVRANPALAGTTRLALIVSFATHLALKMARSHVCRAGSLSERDRAAVRAVVRDEAERSGVGRAESDEVADRLLRALCTQPDSGGYDEQDERCGADGALFLAVPDATDVAVREVVRLAALVSDSAGMLANHLQSALCNGFPGTAQVRSSMDRVFPPVAWFERNVPTGASCSAAFEGLARELILMVRERAFELLYAMPTTPMPTASPTKTGVTGTPLSTAWPQPDGAVWTMEQADRVGITILMQFLLLDNVELSSGAERLLAALAEAVCKDLTWSTPSVLRGLFLDTLASILSEGCARYPTTQPPYPTTQPPAAPLPTGVAYRVNP